MADIRFACIKIMLLIFVFAKADNKTSEENEYYSPDFGDGCANPPKLENGHVSKMENLRGVRTRVAWFKCNEGYKIGAATFRVCQEGRTWSNEGAIKCTGRVPKKEVKKKLQNLARDVQEIEETDTGKLITVGVIVIVVIILLLAVHVGRSVATRKSLQAKYDDVIKSGEKPRQEVPSLFTVSNDILGTCLCCKKSSLPKKFTPKKAKKNKKSKSKDKDDPRDTNENSTIEIEPDRKSRHGHVMFNGGRCLGIKYPRHSGFTRTGHGRYQLLTNKNI